MRLRRSIAGFALVAALAAGVALQRQALVQAKAENRDLQSQIAIRSGDSLSLDRFRGQAVPAPNDEALRDLPRLRNEVRELRAQKQELPGLRSENQELLVRLDKAKIDREVAEPTKEAGFIMNNTWTYAGFGSPEAALQSFFCALRDSNIVNLISCITPDSAQHMGLIVEGRISDRFADRMQFWSMGQIKGYRIAGVEPRADDRVKVKMQAAINGESAEFSVRRIGQDWKIELDR